MSTGLAHSLLQHQDQLCCVADAGKILGPHSQPLLLVGWGGEHLFFTHTTKWQQMRAGPDLPSSCSPAVHPHPVDWVSSTALLIGGAGSTFSQALQLIRGRVDSLTWSRWHGKGGGIFPSPSSPRGWQEGHEQLSHSYALRTRSPEPLTTGPALFCRPGEAQGSPSPELQLVTGRVGSLACCWQGRVRGNGVLFFLAHTTT